MSSIKQHDPTLLVEDASIYSKMPACLPTYAGDHMYTATLMHLTQTLNNIAAKFVYILTKMSAIHYRHLHQYQQSFVTLNSPSPFGVAPQIRCIPQTTGTYPELEAKEPRAFHKRRQLAELLIFFIYLFSFPPPFGFV